MSIRLNLLIKDLEYHKSRVAEIEKAILFLRNKETFQRAEDEIASWPQWKQKLVRPEKEDEEI